jgi:peptidoglycan-associated lipoprotein
MRKKLWIIVALVLVIPAFMLTVSCQKQTVKATEEPEAAAAEAEPAKEEAAPVVEEKAEVAEVTRDESVADDERALMAARNAFLSEHVYFAFDKYNLDDAAQEVLMSKADFLRENPDIYITIEGHCDERGTNEYNLALGDRRAESAKSFLVDMGIEAYRISTVSYGEERPLCNGSNEECWSKNRRDQFVIN